MSVSREVELKLELPIAAAARLLERSFNRLEGNQGMKQHLVSVYFDTAKHALREHGLTLRIRSGGKRRVRTIKAADTASASSSLRLACCRGAPLCSGLPVQATTAFFPKRVLVFTRPQSTQSNLCTARSRRVGLWHDYSELYWLAAPRQVSFIKRSKDRVSLL